MNLFLLKKEEKYVSILMEMGSINLAPFRMISIHEPQPIWHEYDLFMLEKTFPPPCFRPWVKEYELSRDYKMKYAFLR